MPISTIAFTAFNGWVDATDPNNIPSDVRIISAADLLRYETFGSVGSSKINEIAGVVNGHTTTLATNGTAITKAQTDATKGITDAATANTAISTINTTLASHTTDITNLKKAPVVLTKTTSYTALPADRYILTNGASVTITLPTAAAAAAGDLLTVKNINAASATVAAAASGGTIDGAATTTLAQWAKITLLSDGTNWFLV